MVIGAYLFMIVILACGFSWWYGYGYWLVLVVVGGWVRCETDSMVLP